MGVRKEETEVLEKPTLFLYLSIFKKEEEVIRPRIAGLPYYNRTALPIPTSGSAEGGCWRREGHPGDSGRKSLPVLPF